MAGFLDIVCGILGILVGISVIAFALILYNDVWKI